MIVFIRLQVCSCIDIYTLLAPRVINYFCYCYTRLQFFRPYRCEFFWEFYFENYLFFNKEVHGTEKGCFNSFRHRIYTTRLHVKDYIGLIDQLDYFTKTIASYQPTTWYVIIYSSKNQIAFVLHPIESQYTPYTLPRRWSNYLAWRNWLWLMA